MTPSQRDFARQALALPNPYRRSYRNQFIAGDGSPAWQEWEGMVAAEEAERITCAPRAATSGVTAYALTRSAAALAADPGETIDEADFDI